uniref:Uncharacterized protein n=1 Tax=Heterorhabditis bacteriophora TaxID=37862 RepID=A0A1I7WKX8_HETBA
MGLIFCWILFVGMRFSFLKFYYYLNGELNFNYYYFDIYYFTIILS